MASSATNRLEIDIEVMIAWTSISKLFLLQRLLGIIRAPAHPEAPSPLVSGSCRRRPCRWLSRWLRISSEAWPIFLGGRHDR